MSRTTLLSAMLPMLRLLKRLWFAHRDERDARSFVSEPVVTAVLTHNPAHTIYVREYYRYCVALFRDALQQQPRKLHLVFADYPAGDSTLPLRRIAFQIEHTLVKPGGGDSNDAPLSRTPLPTGDGYYLARLLQRQKLAGADLIIDYSKINMEHLRAANGFDDILPRLVTIAPLLHTQCFSREGRHIPALTLFSDPREGRRAALLAAARTRGLRVRNRKRCFDQRSLEALYRSTRVLLNVRRSDHHDTIEELRILPALQSGVIVVSEDGPLRHLLPYARHIVWADYDSLLDRCAEVLNHYDAWHAHLFGGPELPALLETIAAANRAAVERALGSWSTGETTLS